MNNKKYNQNDFLNPCNSYGVKSGNEILDAEERRIRKQFGLNSEDYFY